MQNSLLKILHLHWSDYIDYFDRFTLIDLHWLIYICIDQDCCYLVENSI